MKNKLEKRNISIEINEEAFVNTDGLQDGLNRLAKLSEDSYFLEDILDNTIQFIYQSLPEGKEKYGGENPQIGNIRILRDNVEEYHIAHIQYCPSEEFYKTFKYISKVIAIVDLEKKTYDCKYRMGQTPEGLAQDTKFVLNALGLKENK